MICVLCRRVEVVSRLTSITLARAEFRLTVNHVPAQVCPGCGESYIAEETAVQLLQSMDEMYEAGWLDGRVDYQRLCMK